MYDLSILIPSRNEIFIGKTIENLLENLTGNTEIIVILDGYTIPIPDIPKSPKVTIIGHTSSVGQRAACNEGARLSQSKYLMKMDAHCSIEKGMDSIMLSDMQDNWTCVPTMRNLHAFDWVCKKCGDRRYQGPTPTSCPKCDNKTEFERDMKWIGKNSPQSNSYCFDSTPHFQYFKDYNKRPEGKGDLTETMSLQGSCFMLTKDKWFELNICDENFGSWGSQGIETAVKTHLSGGKVIVNHKTWYGHMFRTSRGDFGFPYPISGNQVQKAKSFAQKLFFENKWEKQIYPLSWLIEKFSPVPGWSAEDLKQLKEAESKTKFKAKEPTKGILYYTDNRLDEKIMQACQEQLKKASDGISIVSVSLKSIDFGKNYILDLDRSPLTMFRQILVGLEFLNTDIVFLAEHDCLYPKEHFEFTPIDRNTFYYNENVYFLRYSDFHLLHYDAKQLSGLVAYREPLIKHFKERIELIEKEGFSRQMGFEPMTHNRIDWINKYKCEGFKSKIAYIDIKHGNNLIRARWKKEEFRNQKFTKGWTETNINDFKEWNLKELLN